MPELVITPLTPASEEMRFISYWDLGDAVELLPLVLSRDRSRYLLALKAEGPLRLGELSPPPWGCDSHSTWRGWGPAWGEPYQVCHQEPARGGAWAPV